MNTLSSREACRREVHPITALEYRDVIGNFGGPGTRPEAAPAGAEPEKKPPRISLTEQELAERLNQAAAAAAQETESKLLQEHERQLQAERAPIGEAIAGFQQERIEYYARVEPELVNLVLAVAGRILHRESQVDRMLLAALASEFPGNQLYARELARIQ